MAILLVRDTLQQDNAVSHASLYAAEIIHVNTDHALAEQGLYCRVGVVWRDEGRCNLLQGIRLLDLDNHLDLAGGSAEVPLDSAEFARIDLRAQPRSDLSITWNGEHHCTPS